MEEEIKRREWREEGRLEGNEGSKIEKQWGKEGKNESIEGERKREEKI